MLGSFLVITGTFFGANLRLEINSTTKLKLQKSFGILIISAGLYLFVGSLIVKGVFLPSLNISSKIEDKNIIEKTEIKWLSSEKEGLKQAMLENKFTVIDFYADWCASCIELDKFTYTDKKVIEELNHFVTIKIDATKNTAEVQELFKKYGIIGLPAVIFIDKKGNFLHNFTISGFLKPEEFLKVINQIKSKEIQRALRRAEAQDIS